MELVRQRGVKETDNGLEFMRREKKYLLTEKSYQLLQSSLLSRFEAESYSGETVCSIYYDTSDHLLIRLSLEHPVYKEKFRVRWYGSTPHNGIVYAEIKKKYRGVVYKRRIPSDPASVRLLEHTGHIPVEAQSAASREMEWLFKRYPLRPAVMIAYEREAWHCRDHPSLRITFDRNLRARDHSLDLEKGDEGILFMQPGSVLMEIKFPGASPLWLARILSQCQVFPTRFSKYGTWFLHQCQTHAKSTEKFSKNPAERR